MAAPVINSVTVDYPSGQSTLKPGQKATITVNAIDPDTRKVTVTVTVMDTNGAATLANSTISVTDTLTYSATATSGTIVQDSTIKNKFIFTA